ncbi:hypothetical protein P7B02_12175 [Caulobacter segnis]|uniref:hypothetical protein n=1 Tax=Caulobacter segnis TaxID=88688 RepID=UPI00240F3294|nr:hypothetical protein [Caulobacter segnis]MDG2522300.1 hypothetical protein [Caulobacter segnis]
MRHLSWIGAAFLLAACNDTPPQDAGASQATSSPVTSVQAPSRAPSVAAPPRYVGRWAAAETACGHAAWRFQDRSVSTPGEVSCTFKDVREAAGGYDVDASCLAEGQTADGRLRLRFTEVTERMTVEGGPFDWKADLIYCGR